jgi:arylsulfatase
VSNPCNPRRSCGFPPTGRLDRRDFLRWATRLGISTAAATVTGCSLAGAPATGSGARTASRPNVILVLVDDMGFGDLGIMGSEIRTPHIDSIATQGVLLSSMYNGARCCPTRAALLTGMYAHRAGIGHMGADLGTPNYQGYLKDDAATVAELLRSAGYRTLMAGKWHVGRDYYSSTRIDPARVDEWPIGAPGHPTPVQRGFERFFGIVDGVTHYFSPWCIVDGGRCVEVSPTDFYFTDAITDRAIGMIEQSVAGEQPFFLYLAHAAPHWPLHAHDEDIARYDGVYARGWDTLRTARHEEMQSRGVLRHRWEISARDPDAPAWSDVADKDWEASRMAVYAAMVDRMDQQIGRLLQTLRQLGQHDNTLVMLLSDNGGCAETIRADGWAKYYPDTTRDGRHITLGNVPGLRPGGAQTYMSYDLPWANVSNTPFRLFKHWVHEGGISTPLLAQWPARFGHGGVSHEPCHVVDVLPTILDAAGVAHPRELAGKPLLRPDGESLLSLFEGRRWSRDQPLFWEHEGNAAVRVGNLKAVRRFNAPWELYDMDADRTELHDLSRGNARLLASLTRRYDEWTADAGVEDWNVLQPRLMKAWGLQEIRG